MTGKSETTNESKFVDSVTVAFVNIPSYLRAGSFYKQLCEEQDTVIDARFYPVSDMIVNFSDLAKLVTVLNFWGVTITPTHLEQFCRANNLQLNEGTELDHLIVLAIRQNLTELVRYLVLGQNGFSAGSDATTAAAACGRLDVLVLLHKHGYHWDTSTCAAAARAHLDCLAYLHEQGCPWDVMTTYEAAEAGNLECLRYALMHGCPIHVKAYKQAGRNNHTDCCLLLREHGARCDDRAPNAAAMRGDLANLTYIHEHGGQWDTMTTDRAALFGQVSTLRYAMHHGCDYSEVVVQYAAKSSDLSSLKYLIDEQGLYLKDDGSVFQEAFLRANLPMVEYLLDMGCSIVEFHFPSATLWKSETRLFTSTHHLCDRDIMDAQLVQCIDRAVMWGWQPDANLLMYVCYFEFVECEKYLLREGFV